MPAHHPGTFIHHNNIDLTDVPWALTTHLLSINHDQLLRATRHPFLARAANGTLSKSVIASWLANDRIYLEGYTNLNNNLLNQIRSQKPQAIDGGAASAESDIETRLIAWLEAGVQNGKREMKFFQEVAEIYKIDMHPSPLPQHLKLEGLRRYETLFTSVAAHQPNAFIPWLEGVTLLWATEKVYYEAWSWARRQDAQSSPRTFDNDEDGGAMRREFIPNWSNRDFLMFVEQLERILNEGVSQAVNRDDARWQEVKTRTEAIWQAVLDAEEVFWPDVSGTKDHLKEAVTGGVRGDLDGSTLNSVNGD
ncbi:Nn.00g068070.m01.CDS01 [Neocucurbitaria sp. VM-36]